jgi:hypothetical protein
MDQTQTQTQRCREEWCGVTLTPTDLTDTLTPGLCVECSVTRAEFGE